MRVLKELSDCRGEYCFSDVMASDLFLSLIIIIIIIIMMKTLLNENFIEFFMHLQFQISLLKVIYNWLLDTLYITLHMDIII
jgi:hypothetical protein